MTTLDLDALTAVELPDRHVMSPVTLVFVDVHGNTVNVLSFNDIAAAINACGNVNVLSVQKDAGRVICRATAEA